MSSHKHHKRKNLETFVNDLIEKIDKKYIFEIKNNDDVILFFGKGIYQLRRSDLDKKLLNTVMIDFDNLPTMPMNILGELMNLLDIMNCIIVNKNFLNKITFLTKNIYYFDC